MTTNTSILLSDFGLGQMIGVLRRSGVCLLPTADSDPAVFQAARKEWIQAGLIAEDFDGKMHPSQLFARMHRNILDMGAVLHFKSEDQELYYVRGPVDLLKIQHLENQNWKLELRPTREVLTWLKIQMPALHDGVLETQSMNDGHPLRDEIDQMISIDEAQRDTRIQEHIHIFFKIEEEQNAGNSLGDNLLP